MLQIQGPTLRVIANLAESEDMAKNLIKCGITPKSTMVIIEYYQVELIFCFIFFLFLLQSYARHHSVLVCHSVSKYL